MLMQEITAELIESWKATYMENRPNLKANRKSGLEIVEYLKQKYPVQEENSEAIKKVLLFNVMQNECHRDKLPEGKEPVPVGFILENEGKGKLLYEKQDDVFNGKQIVIGVEVETGFFFVEGSSLLWDELFAFRGLDEEDLDNFYLVAEYIACLEKFGQ
ncbi:MAG: hypothetical protein PHQ50_07800 [Eubacteriales bacterium]|nr:hypothetical protein [Eubacteriales bacterium]MDD3350792.1 hypothetical protein [Eubacteriales bacterium]